MPCRGLRLNPSIARPLPRMPTHSPNLASTSPHTFDMGDSLGDPCRGEALEGIPGRSHGGFMQLGCPGDTTPMALAGGTTYASRGAAPVSTPMAPKAAPPGRHRMAPAAPSDPAAPACGGAGQGLILPTPPPATGQGGLPAFVPAPAPGGRAGARLASARAAGQEAGRVGGPGGLRRCWSGPGVSRCLSRVRRRSSGGGPKGLGVVGVPRPRNSRAGCYRKAGMSPSRKVRMSPSWRVHGGGAHVRGAFADECSGT